MMVSAATGWARSRCKTRGKTSPSHENNEPQKAIKHSFNTNGEWKITMGGDETWKVQPAGLLGPVRLLPSKHVKIPLATQPDAPAAIMNHETSDTKSPIGEK
jgi:hypothetical protein